MRRIVTLFKAQPLHNTVHTEFSTKHSQKLHLLNRHTKIHNIQAILSNEIDENPTTKLLALYSSQSFRKKLCDFADTNISVCYALNRKLLIEMLPKNVPVSALSKEFLGKALEIREAANVMASNPYKDIETLRMIQDHHIEKVVACTQEEVENIRKVNQNAQIIWEFEDQDSSQALQTLIMLNKQGQSITSLKFLSAISLNPTLLVSIISQLKPFFTPSKIYLTVPSHSLDELQPSLNLLKQYKVIIQVTDLSSTENIICLGKVIGVRRKNGIVHFDADVEQFIEDKDREEIYAKNASLGDWVSFRPKRVMGLDCIAMKEIKSQNKKH